MDTKLVTMALRGLTLPEPTRKEMRKTGVYCRATIQLVCQQQSRRWALRGEEAGRQSRASDTTSGSLAQTVSPFRGRNVSRTSCPMECTRSSSLRNGAAWRCFATRTPMNTNLWRRLCRDKFGFRRASELAERGWGGPMDQFPWRKSLRLRNVSPLGIFHLFDQEHKESRCGWLALATCGVPRAHPHQSVRGLVGIVVVQVMRGKLKIPFQRSCIDVQRHNAIRIQVISRSRVSYKVGPWIAGNPVQSLRL